MCKDLPVIPVNWLADNKRIIRKMEGQGGGEAQGVADPPPQKKKKNCFRPKKKPKGVIFCIKKRTVTSSGGNANTHRR
jgi:hypothetical protein